MSFSPIYRSSQPRLEPVPFFNSTGAAITGVAYGTPVVSYRTDNQSAWTSVTLAAGTLGTYTASTWVEDSDGLYQLCLPEAAYSVAGSTQLLIRITGVSGQYPATNFMQRDIVSYNPQDGQALGLTALPSSGTTTSNGTNPNFGTVTVSTLVV